MSGAGRPEDFAVRPKPPMNAKRPFKAGAALPTPSVLKKPRIDFGAGAKGAIATLNTASGSSSSMAPKWQYDMTWRDTFCCNTPVGEVLGTAIKDGVEGEKWNKVARNLCACLREWMDRRDATGRFSLDARHVALVAVTIKQNAAKLVNLHLHKALLSLLGMSKQFAAEKQALVASLITCLLDALPSVDAYYMSAFIHDSMGERHWVDRPSSHRLLSYMLCPFGTLFPGRGLFAAAGCEPTLPDWNMDTSVADRFSSLSPSPDDLVLATLRPLWESRDTPPRNLLRTMCMLCGSGAIRHAAASRLDGWLQNAKLQRHALELLLFVGCNMGAALKSAQEKETMEQLLRLRSLKSKQVLTVFCVALREWMQRGGEEKEGGGGGGGNARASVRLILVNEFGPSPARFPYNMIMLQSMFTIDSAAMVKILAEELAAHVIAREESTKPVRLFLRELVRSFLRADFSFSRFTEAFLAAVTKEAEGNEHGLQEHVPRSSVEVCTALPIVAALQPAVKEAAASRRQGIAPSDPSSLHRFEKEVQHYYAAAMGWLCTARSQFTDGKQYVLAYYKMLYLTHSDYYTQMDQGPSEAEWMHASRVLSECRLTEQMMDKLCSPRLQLEGTDAVELVSLLTRRAVANQSSLDAHIPLVDISDGGLLTRLFRLPAYRPPNMTAKDREEPEWRCLLADVSIASLYWKMWLSVVLLTCAGGEGGGGGGEKSPIAAFYDAQPQLRLFVRMIMTGEFRFPVGYDGQSPAEVAASSKEAEEAESVAVLSLETRLAGQPITAGNSHLLSVLFHTGRAEGQSAVARCPPRSLLRDLAALCGEHGVRMRLCQWRETDVLGDTVRHVGVEKVRAAVEELVRSIPSSISHVPVECVCDLLVSAMHTRVALPHNIDEVASRLRTAVSEISTEEESTRTVLCLLGALSSPSAADREAAAKAIAVVVGGASVRVPTPFDLSKLTGLKHFDKFRSPACVSLSLAARQESQTDRLGELLRFLAHHVDVSTAHQISLHMSSLAERAPATVAPLLTLFFAKYIEVASHPDASWSSEEAAAERITVKSRDRELSVTRPAFSSILALLCSGGEGEGREGGGEAAARSNLLDLCFPRDAPPPKIVSSCGEEQALTAEMRARMLCTSDERIIRVALTGVDAVTAMRMLCSFGLTGNSAGQLMSVLDEKVDELFSSPEGMQLARQARPFVRGYRSNGARGGEKLLARLDTEQTTRTKEEKMEEGEVVSWTEPPSLVAPLEIPPLETSNAKSMAARLKSLSSAAAADFRLTPADILSMCASEDTALRCLEHLEGNVRFFFTTGAESAAQAMLTALAAAGSKFPSVLTRLSAFSARVLKSAAAGPSVAAFLRQFVGGAGAGAGEKEQNKKLSSDEILAQLTREDGQSMSQTERARLLHSYLLNQLEVVDKEGWGRLREGGVEGEERTRIEQRVKEQLRLVLSVPELVAEMPVRCSPETLAAVCASLLDGFDARISARSVLDVLQSTTGRIVLRQSHPQSRLNNLAAWLTSLCVVESGVGGGAEKGEEEEEEQKARLAGKRQTVRSMLSCLVEECGVWCVPPLVSFWLRVVRSDGQSAQRQQAQWLVDEAHALWPCLRVSSLSNKCAVVGGGLAVAEGDVLTTQLMIDAFEKDDVSEMAGAVETLTQLLFSHPQLVLRQMGMMSRLLCRIVEMNGRELREKPPRRAAVDFAVQAARQLLPLAKEGDWQYIDQTFSMLMAFYDRHGGGAAGRSLAEELAQLAVAYLEENVSCARSVLSDHAPLIQSMASQLADGRLASVLIHNITPIKG